MFLASQRMTRATGALVEKVVAEVAEVDVVGVVGVVDGVAIHIMREVVFEDKMVIKMAQD